MLLRLTFLVSAALLTASAEGQASFEQDLRQMLTPQIVSKYKGLTDLETVYLLVTPFVESSYIFQHRFTYLLDENRIMFVSEEDIFNISTSHYVSITCRDISGSGRTKCKVSIVDRSIWTEPKILWSRQMTLRR